MEVERSKVEQSIAKQRQESERLDKEEEKYWIQYNEYQKQLLEFEEEQQRFLSNLLSCSFQQNVFQNYPQRYEKLNSY